MWVFDATPLIYLAKVDRLGLVEHIEGTCVSPQRVATEVVETGLEQGYTDARRIDRAVDDGTFETVEVDETPLFARLAENPNLSDADVAVLACAESHDGIAVMDEACGRDVATTEGITTRGTAFLVLQVATHGHVGPDEARTVIDAMVEEGWYCAPDVYAKLVQSIESIED